VLRDEPAEDRSDGERERGGAAPDADRRATGARVPERVVEDGERRRRHKRRADALAVSTFYVYFDGNEAAAFAGDDERAVAVERVLTERPDAEPLHATLRRASHAVVDVDLSAPDQLALRLELIRREPKLAAYAARLQAGHLERFAGLVADQLGVEAVRDPRPRVVVSALFGALNAAWAARPPRWTSTASSTWRTTR
jgi:transcriptional regulator MftR-like protein